MRCLDALQDVLRGHNRRAAILRGPHDEGTAVVGAADSYQASRLYRVLPGECLDGLM